MDALTIPGLVVRAEPGTRLTTRAVDRTALELTARSDDGLPALEVEIDLADAVAYWHPGERGGRVLPPDWSAGTVTSLVRSAPMGALYTAAGDVLLGWAAGESVAELSIRFGVSEERKAFVVGVRSVRPLNNDLVVIVDGARDGFVTTVRRLGAWLSHRCAGPVLVPPAVTRVPAYSTWYAFSQDINAQLVTAEAALAAELGCGLVFLDDGWQRLARGRGYRGCGDWLPDEAKFDDLADTVKTIHVGGMRVALWVAPLLLGRRSDAFGRLGHLAPHRSRSLNCHVLDPRDPQVRTHVAETCLRLVQDYDVDLLKIDFLDAAMVYQDTAGTGDRSDVGLAMADLLREVRGELADAGRAEVAFEFRHPYVSPPLARFGEILRANDCPADSLLNRCGTIDARLMSVGQVVHADPMMWGPTGGAEAVAQQLYSTWFAVPQISMRLADLPDVQVTALDGLLRLWRDHAEVTLDGTLEIQGAERGYDLVRAVRIDLGRSVIARYAPLVVDLDEQPTTETTVINATPVNRLMLRTARRISEVIVRSATAAETTTMTFADHGVIDLTVPPYGSVTIRM